MSETYTIGGDALYLLDHLHVAGQTFTPVQDHIVQYIDLNLESSFLTAPVRIDIHRANAWHEPIGDPIASARADTPNPLIPSVSRVRASIYTPVLLNARSKYALLAYYKGLIFGTRASWQYDQALARYPGGHRIASNDGGATWTHHWDSDHIFCEFGAPPLPKPLPLPPVEHFAILDLRQDPIPDGIRITIPTSVPCNLTAFITEEPPGKHPRTRTVRGITVPWYTYFCFVAYKQYKQIEAGDTLYHTFDITDWPEGLVLLTIFDPTTGLHPPYWEPWGDTLTENNPWTLLPPHTPPEYDLTNGLLTLKCTDYESKGIRCDIPPLVMPLHDLNHTPLYFNALHTYTAGNPLTHRYAIFLWTTKFPDSYHILLVISRGDQWVNFGENKAAFPTRGIMDYGQGPTPLNLVDLWIELRRMAGLPDDPTGWTVDYVRCELLQIPEGGTNIITTDYINLYYPKVQYKLDDPQTRWLAFKGDVNFITSPSVSPIIQKIHPPPIKDHIILRPNAPGDKCSLFGYPHTCPYNYRDIDDIIADDDYSSVRGQSRPPNPLLDDLYQIENPTETLSYIEAIQLIYRIKGVVSPTKAGAGLKTHGAEYPGGFVACTGSWTTHMVTHFRNPFTHLPWTWDEIKDLQIGLRLARTAMGLGWAYCTQIYLNVIYWREA